MAKLLEVRNVRFTYPGGVRALNRAHLAVDRREVVAVIGPNGCGKTTLLLIAAGLLRPEEGEVLLEGRPLSEQLPEARRRIGLVFQDPDDQLFNPTVYDEIAFALRQLGLAPTEVDSRVRSIAGRLGILALLERSPYMLSVGEKKKVALASVLVYEPEIVLLDEPAVNLDVYAKRIVERLIKELKERGRAVVVATHDIELAARIADFVYVMREGVTVSCGPAREVLCNDRLLLEAGIEPPFAVRLYRSLIKTDGKAPLTLEELLLALRACKGLPESSSGSA